MMDSTIKILQQRFRQQLPGIDAQLKMAPDMRRFFYEIPEGAVHAGVLILLFPKGQEWHMALIERKTHHKDKHSGQISFPGGKLEKTDKSHAAGALREAEEEIGIPVEDVQILGALTPLFIYVSNFAVYPFVGVVDYYPEFSLQPDEVNEILEVPVSAIQTAAFVKQKDMRVRSNITLKQVPYYELLGHVVWGATAMILSEFNELISL